MPPAPRQPRSSLQTHPPDDISTLTLPQIRLRLERNERVLQTSLFSSPSPSSSPTLSISPSSSTSTTDPVRDKLLLSRQQLLQREKELVSAQRTELPHKVEILPNGHDDPATAGESSAGARRRSRASLNSGKARAMERIQAGDERPTRNIITL